ncbi:mannose-1-phosphate guanylyltransferase [Planctomicrobium piriforme]|uniref:mannose-1-phosphate guanylyltransferase n=1 Tax=Planctomicrobium piriforme TaxID=1576369 RepID=A0A1I3EZ44_9PLAN|nr:mannose-1-phosphate guanylyltransferase [Planctomicrobium piriforme]SFI04274.1 mannose-1-phosphate guanylyltransferase [Planctomicrobium piriforme]
MLHAVIMAGGLGTRFWPLSRRASPKQFLTLQGERSLIQSAFDLAAPLMPAEQCWVVTGGQFVELTHEHLPSMPVAQILQEPCGRNTAPCIGLAALQIAARDPEATLLVMPADHVIAPAERFANDVQAAVDLIDADPERLVLFGKPPTFPATGFGYIHRGEPLAPGAYTVAGFREKPDRDTAESYLRSGEFFWNCGIFVWRASRILELLRTCEPELGRQLDELARYVGKPEWDAALNDIFPRMKSISIDYAVLERAPKIAVVEVTFDWDDVGSWEALARLLPGDSDGNVSVGPFVGLDTSGCIVRSTSEHLIATVGIENCVIVHTPHATLISRRDDEQGMRRLMALLTEQGRAADL